MAKMGDKMGKAGWLKGVLALLFLFTSPSAGYGDVGDLLPYFHPHLTLQEEYTDNLFLTPRDKSDDFITTLLAGLTFSTLPPAPFAQPATQPRQRRPQPSGIDLNYSLGFVSYANNPDLNYISHLGTLNTWYTVGRRLTIRLSEYFLRSEEPRERDYAPAAPADQFLLATQRTRSVYIRNVFEPSVEYQFGREDRLTLGYRNNIYQSQNPSIENSREDSIYPSLTYWFNIRNGISLEYVFTRAAFERSPDFTAQGATGRYTYRFSPRTSIFGEYTYLKREFESPGISYDVQSPGIGMEHAFTPTLNGQVRLGFFRQKPDQGSAIIGPTYLASLTKTARQTVYSISFSGGYTEVYFTAENLGFTKYHRASANITHRFEEEIILGASGSLERAEYAFPADRKDWLWRISGDASYPILRWLTLSLSFYHQADNSNVADADFTENRGILRLTATL